MRVKSGGLLFLGAKLSLGTSTGCGYAASAESGGEIDVGGTGSDRLNICGRELMKGNGSCNSCGGTYSGTCAYNNQPYCEPSGGFTGPTGYGETGYTSTLPVRLVGFSATVVGNVVEFTWATDKEENFDHFEIERADDQLKFTTVASIPGTGSSTSFTEYTAVDRNPLIGTHYYRLKAVDRDQTFEYVKLVPVDFSGSKEFIVLPNPTNGSSITYQINFEPTPGDHVVLVDAVGNVLQTASVSNTKDELIPSKTLRSGAYVLRYVSSKRQYATRVFVKD
jgi:hypothetical protein